MPTCPRGECDGYGWVRAGTSGDVLGCLSCSHLSCLASPWDEAHFRLWLDSVEIGTLTRTAPGEWFLRLHDHDWRSGTRHASNAEALGYAYLTMTERLVSDHA